MQERPQQHARSFSMASLGLVALSSLFVVAAVFPHIPTNLWWVRVADFPRIQLLVPTAVLGVACLAFSPWWSRAMGVLALIAAISHGAAMWPYRARSLPEPTCAESPIRLLVANVLQENREVLAIVELVKTSDADVVVLLETGAFWREALVPLIAEWPHAFVAPHDEHFGMIVLSRIEIEGDFEEFGGQPVPSFVGRIRAPGQGWSHLYALHPRPPQIGIDSTARDAQLFDAAFQLRSLERVLVLGDLNAPSWGRTMQRFLRLAELRDPREGRGIFPSYSAKSWWESWPLDHILHNGAFQTVALERLEPSGSDHYPMQADLCLTQRPLPDPELEKGDVEEASKDIEQGEAAPEE